MLVVAVCVGSSCHLRRAYKVIEKLEDLIQSYRLKDNVELKASFCMENCSCGTSIRIGDQAPLVVPDISSLERIFQEQVLPQIRREI